MKDEALRLALEALKSSDKLINGDERKMGLCDALDGYYGFGSDIEKYNKQTNKAITALKEALAQPTGQAPCARHCESTAYEIVIRGLKGDIERLKAAQRTWVGLTEEEIDAIYWQHENHCGEYKVSIYPYERAIEAKLKEKNT
jgi:uncharacterized protein YecT (DUF1311 family)